MLYEYGSIHTARTRLRIEDMDEADKDYRIQIEVAGNWVNIEGWIDEEDLEHMVNPEAAKFRIQRKIKELEKQLEELDK